MIFEQPWWSMLGRDLPVRVRLGAEAAVRGFLPRILVVPGQERPVERLLAETARMGRDGVVVVGPLLSYEWRSFVSRAPSLRFILIGSIDGTQLPGNALALSFDRVSAFREAGAAAARAAVAAGGKTGVLVCDGSDLADAETAAFVEGASGVVGSPAASLVALPAAPERAAVDAAVKQMRDEGVAVLLLGLGSRNPWALETLGALGGRAVVAGWSWSRPAPAQVLLSIEEDVPGGIARGLSALSRGERQVAGPVIVVNGAASERGAGGR